MRTYSNQFPWGCLVKNEIETILKINDGLMDDSWGNDVSPKIIFGDDFTVWVDHPDPNMRELDNKQFVVEKTVVDDRITLDYELERIFDTDSLGDLVCFLEMLIKDTIEG